MRSKLLPFLVVFVLLACQIPSGAVPSTSVPTPSVPQVSTDTPTVAPTETSTQLPTSAPTRAPHASRVLIRVMDFVPAIVLIAIIVISSIEVVQMAYRLLTSGASSPYPVTK